MASSQAALQQPADASKGENAAAEEKVWDEERLENALKTLKEMHIQLRGLRSTVPRLIAPLTTKQPSPETLFREFSKSANDAIQEVQEFRRLMTAEDSQRVMDQSRTSRAANPKGIRSWRVTEDPDWYRRDA